MRYGNTRPAADVLINFCTCFNYLAIDVLPIADINSYICTHLIFATHSGM